MKTTVKILLAVLLAICAWLFWCWLTSPVNAMAWEPGQPPALAGVLAPDTRLQQAELLAAGRIRGPEDIAVAADGSVYSGLHDGRIVRIVGSKVETLANTGGRPLGMAFDASGSLIVCDAWKGLLKLTPAGELQVLATEADGLPFAFADDLDIASDGKIYFTDASSKWQQPDYLLDYLEGRPHGRLLVYDPATGRTETLVDGLYFANGVALSHNEDFVAVAETYRYRLGRYWLRGPKAGLYEVFADNLPGMPDNINSDRHGIIWVALPSPRKAIADFADRRAWVRRLVAGLPRFLWPRPDAYGLAIAVNENGNIVQSLHDASGKHLRMVTSVYPWQGWLYVGSLENDRIGRLPAPALPATP